jgi:hypothetical protein
MALTVGCGQDVDAFRTRDIAEVTTALETNIAAIRRRDTEGYLAHYLDSPDLVIVSADSLRRGFLFFAEARRADPTWPDTLVIGPPTVVWLGPGVVWAGFQFLAVIGPDTTRGVSERVFVKTRDGWKITITGSMER